MTKRLAGNVFNHGVHFPSQTIVIPSQTQNRPFFTPSHLQTVTPPPFPHQRLSALLGKRFSSCSRVAWWRRTLQPFPESTMALGLEKRPPELYEKARAERTHVSKHKGLRCPLRPTLWSLLLVLWALISRAQCSRGFEWGSQRLPLVPVEAMEHFSSAAFKFSEAAPHLSFGPCLLRCQCARGPASGHFMTHLRFLQTRILIALGHSSQEVP